MLRRLRGGHISDSFIYPILCLSVSISLFIFLSFALSELMKEVFIRNSWEICC